MPRTAPAPVPPDTSATVGPAPGAADLPALPAAGAVTISVVIPARDAAATLRRAVDAVLAQRPAPDEVVLAVGPSRDATAEVAASLTATHPGRVHVVDNPTGRTPQGLNAAIEATTGQVIARVDAHCELPDGYLAAALDTLRASGAGNVGAVQRPVAEGGFAAAVATAMRSPLGSGGADYRAGGRPGPVDTAYLGVFRREALDAVGGYDPVFTRNQDAELNLRMARAGYPVWLDPRMVAAYRPRATVRGLARQYLDYGRWRRHTVRTHPGSLRLRQLIPPAAVLAVLTAAGVSALMRDGRPVGVVGGGYLGAVVGGALAATGSAREVPAVALALTTMHASWGLGFVLGPPAGEVDRP